MPPADPHLASLADLGATCPRCRYELHRTAGATCPECGADTSPAAIVRAARRRDIRRRWSWSAAILVPCIYAPYLWIFVIDAPWSDYRWWWAKMFPVVPGFVPTMLLRLVTKPLAGHTLSSNNAQFATHALVTATIVIAALWLGSRGRRWLVATAIVVLSLSVACALGAYAAFLA